MPILYGELGDTPPVTPANSSDVSPNNVFGLQCWSPQYQPRETMVAAMTLPFTGDISSITVNANELISQEKIDAFRTVYVDNSTGAEPVTFDIATTLQRVTCPAFSQAWLPILAPNPPEITVTSINADFLRVHFLNIVMPPTVIVIGDPT